MNLPEGAYAGAVQIAASIDSPANYLGKLLGILCRAGLLDSQKGFNGGFRLARPAEEIRLLDIVEPVEQLTHWRQCVLGEPVCSNASPCALHSKWNAIAGQYIEMLETTKLSDLKDRARPLYLT